MRGQNRKLWGLETGLLIPSVDVVHASWRFWYPMIEGRAGSVAMDYSIGQHILLVACMLSCIWIDAVVPKYEVL